MGAEGIFESSYFFSAGPKMLRNNSKKNKSPERAISFRHWTALDSTTNSDDYEDIDWKPISRHQRTRKPINLSGGRVVQ